MADTITADMVIHDVVTRYPATVKVFHGHGLPCTACAVGRGIPLTMADPSKKVKQVVAIMSGKGGVGKSLVTGLIAVSLRRQGQRVGILDGDITGPSIARMFGTTGSPSKSASGGIEPLRSKGGVKVMSMNM